MKILIGPGQSTVVDIGDNQVSEANNVTSLVEKYFGKSKPRQRSVKDASAIVVRDLDEYVQRTRELLKIEQDEVGVR